MSPTTYKEKIALQSNLNYLNRVRPGQNVEIDESSDNRGAHYYSGQLDYYYINII